MIFNLFTDKLASHIRFPSAVAGSAHAVAVAAPELALEHAVAVSADPDPETKGAGGHP